MSSEKIKTEEQSIVCDLLDLEDLKNKEELIHEIQAICKANKDNDYFCTYQLKDMIDKTFKIWGY